MFKLNPSALVLSLSVAALLSACGGGGGSAAAPSLSGVAAVGDPIVGGDVDAKCSDGNTYSADPTSTAGAWSIATVPAAAFPCVVQIRNGNPASMLNSYAISPGIVNITPFTDLVLAMAAGNPSEYFDNINIGNAADITNEVNAAITKFKSALIDKDYLQPSESFDPINARFSAKSGDFYDDLLEAFKQGLSDGSKTYEQFLADVSENPDAISNLPKARPKEVGGGTTTPSTDTVPATVHSKLVGTYHLNFKQGGGEGCGSTCSFVENQAVTAVVGSDNTLTINGKKLTNPFNNVNNGKPHLPEIIWRDGSLAYALSNNDDTFIDGASFNEINLGKVSGGSFIFLGQLRDTTVTPSDDPAEKLKSFVGSYAPEFVLKSGSYNLPSQGKISKPPVNTPFTAVISASGVVTVDGVVFDPEALDYKFIDFSTRKDQLPSYSMSYSADEKTTMSLDIFLDDDEVVAWKVARTTDNGGGSFGVSYVLLEGRPYPAAQQTLFDSLVTASKSGSELGIQLVALIDGLGYMKCDQLALEVVKDTGRGQPYRYFLYNLTSDDRSKPAGNIDGYTSSLPYKPYAFPQEFDRRYMRYSSESMNETLLFQVASIVKRSDGFINYESSSTGTLKGSATNNPAEISSAECPAIKPLPEDEPV